MNENGEMFADFYAEYILVVGGSLFPHKPVQKATWVSPHQTMSRRTQYNAYVLEDDLERLKCSKSRPIDPYK